MITSEQIFLSLVVGAFSFMAGNISGFLSGDKSGYTRGFAEGVTNGNENRKRHDKARFSDSDTCDG